MAEVLLLKLVDAKLSGSSCGIQSCSYQSFWFLFKLFGKVLLQAAVLQFFEPN